MAKTPCAGVGMECRNWAHDHFTDDPLDKKTEGGGRLCNHCLAPCHWDQGDQQYHHDNPDEADCFLISERL